MTILICPRWRKARPPSPSGVVQFGNDDQSGAQEGQAHGQASERDVLLDDGVDQNEQQPESFSHRLRRRFSRESRPFNGDTSKLGFPFNLKSMRPLPKSNSQPAQNLATIGNLGSSLMSERAYDSDAQYITTPRHNGHRLRSSSAKPARRMGLSDLMERSHEQEPSEQKWPVDHNPNLAISQQSTPDKQFISTPTVSTGSLRGSPHTPQLVYQQCGQQRNPLEAEVFLGSHEMIMKPARSLPDLTTKFQPSIPSFTVTPATINVPRPSGDPRSLAEWKDFLKESGPDYGLSSSDTLHGHPANLAVKKNRQPSDSARSFTDPRSIHLDGMDISQRLASQTTASGSMSCNNSSPRLIHPNKHGFFVSPSEENLHPPYPRCIPVSGADSPTPVAGKRDFSSFYSPHSGSISSNRSHIDAPKSTGKLNMSNSQTNGNHDRTQSNQTQETGAMQSKFREHCESNDSEQAPPQNLPHDSEQTGYLRKVSDGWMSGGKRVGYGYTLVPDEDEKQDQSTESYRPYRKPESEWEAEAMSADLNNQKANDTESQGQVKDASESTADLISGSTPRAAINTSNIHGNTNCTPVSTAKTIGSMKEYHTPPYLRAILGSRPDQSLASSPAKMDERAFKSLRAPELPPMTQTEHCQVPKSTKYSNQANDSFSKKWSRVTPSPKQGVITSGDNADDGYPEYLDLYDQIHAEESCALKPSNSRSEKWTRYFARRRESRRVSRIHQQESSQSSSEPYEDCESESLPPSNTAEDLASMYQDCVDMPGSFDGSRWASRKSRILWDACTEGLWHSA